MANPEHLEKLRQGVQAWNEWRREHPRIKPDLQGAELNDLQLAGANLNETDLRRAKLHLAKLYAATLYDADLRGAELWDADVCGADLRGADFTDAEVDGIRYDKTIKCLGAQANGSTGSSRFRRTLAELDYIESFSHEHPVVAAFWSMTSDYGRSPGRVALFALAIILAFAVIYALNPGLIHWQVQHDAQSSRCVSFLNLFYFSVSTFATLGIGDMVPARPVGEILVICEVLLGYLWLGYFLSVFASRALPRT
jgi:hypothetical protein